MCSIHTYWTKLLWSRVCCILCLGCFSLNSPRTAVSVLGSNTVTPSENIQGYFAITSLFSSHYQYSIVMSPLDITWIPDVKEAYYVWQLRRNHYKYISQKPTTCWGLHPGARWKLQEQKHMDPRLVGTRRLMVEISGPPCYLTSNQSEESHISWSPTPRFAFKNSSLKATGKFGLFEHWDVHSPCLALAINLSLLQTLTLWFAYLPCRAHKLGINNILSHYCFKFVFCSFLSSPPSDTVHLRLAFEPMCQYSNTARIQIGNRIHSLLNEIALLSSGLNEAQVLYISLQKEFS